MKIRLNHWHLLLLPPFFFLGGLSFVIIDAMMSNLSEGQFTERTTASISSILLFAQLAMLALLFFYARMQGTSLVSATLNSRNKGMDILLGICLGLFIAIGYFYCGLTDLISYLQLTFGDYVPPGETSAEVSGNIPVFFIANVILAPFVEEHIYRNVAFKALVKRYKPYATVLISAIFFGLLHWMGGFWYMVFTAIVIGIPFGLIQLKRNSILIVFTAHLTMNFFEFLVAL